MFIIYISLILMSFLAQAFFSASEMAYTTIDKLDLKGRADDGDSKASDILKFLGIKADYLGATLVGTNLAVVIASALTTRLFIEFLPGDTAAMMTTVLLVPLSLIFGEIVPKIIAGQHPFGTASWFLAPLKAFHRLFSPIIYSVNRTAAFILSPFRVDEEGQELHFTKSDLKKFLVVGHETGGVEQDEMELIHKVLDFGTKKVERIMVPMYRVSSVSVNDRVQDLKKLISLTGYSRVPVYEGNKKNIIGIVNIYDVLFEKDPDPDDLVRDHMREPITVNRYDNLDIALARLRHRKQPMGIITGYDEDIVGIVTIEDILEEIVGEIEDSEHNK